MASRGAQCLRWKPRPGRHTQAAKSVGDSHLDNDVANKDCWALQNGAQGVASFTSGDSICGSCAK